VVSIVAAGLHVQLGDQRELGAAVAEQRAAVQEADESSIADAIAAAQARREFVLVDVQLYADVESAGELHRICGVRTPGLLFHRGDEYDEHYLAERAAENLEDLADRVRAAFGVDLSASVLHGTTEIRLDRDVERRLEFEAGRAPA
jgi:hypothetical protein